ncbi:MAG: Crp/Fnr family transcriptional regulator [Desulfatibacillaceae bacterium]|nr:Crp/Fnr family transcriptional regulator [Desulfatibacillaceae bacterium]
MDALELVSHIPLFKGLSGQDKQRLAEMLRVQKVRAGEVLFRKGSEGTTLYIIQEGVVKIVLPSRLGDEMILTIFSAGDFFGEMALLDGKPRSADAVAVEPSRLLLLNRSDFLHFLTRNESAIIAIFSALSARLRKTDDLLEDASFLNIPARFAKKLIELGDTFGKRSGDTMEISMRLTQKDLADMVGATRESINKELRVLREKGIVSLSGNLLKINDINLLKRRIR